MPIYLMLTTLTDETYPPQNEMIALGQDGNLLWQLSTPLVVRPPAVGQDGTLYAETEEYSSNPRWGMYEVNPNGTIRWSLTNMWYAQAPANFAPPLLWGNDRLWIGGPYGVCLLHPDEDLVWWDSGPTGSPIGMAPSPDGGVYFASVAGLVAVRPDASIRWLIAGADFISAPVVGKDGTIYVGTDTNALVAVDSSGIVRWAATTDGAVGAPAVGGADGGIFFGTLNGTFHAVNADGSPRWQFNAGSAIRTPPTLTPGGQVVFGTDCGLVWSLRTDTVLAAAPWPKYQGDLANHGRTEGLMTVPGIVTNLAANVVSPGGTVIHVTWESAPEAESYEVWRAAEGGLDQAEPLATNVFGTLGFDDEFTRAGVVYSYWVRSKNGEGYGPFIEPVTCSQTNQSWVVPFNGYTTTPVVAEDGTVYVKTTGTSSELRALSPSGSTLWSVADAAYGFKGYSSSPVIGQGGNLVFGFMPYDPMGA
ncbi:MAG: PQQ-binding-like beta-propeller repeat protein [Candidatus Omnitrophica bacterium]|nr:PQQ-binding-like beta-propeller repeat protein [Candidatus Omnitrophota bacterium]